MACLANTHDIHKNGPAGISSSQLFISVVSGLCGLLMVRGEPESKMLNVLWRWELKERSSADRRGRDFVPTQLR